MNPQLEVITYGNPTREQLEKMQQATPYDYLLPIMFDNTHCPSNISTLTHDELKELVQYQQHYNFLPESTKRRYEAYDKDLSQATANYIYNKTGINIKEAFDEMIQETKPVLLKLKYKFQRPRPYQLAWHFKQSIFPIFSLTANSPSFPSGHIFQLTLLTETMGNIHPSIYDHLKHLMSEVCEQRLFYGLHYPSDCDAAQQLAKTITRSKEWTKKYNI
jgi:hypothetical protein